jgi:hypothetical protein
VDVRRRLPDVDPAPYPHPHRIGFPASGGPARGFEDVLEVVLDGVAQRHAHR